MELETDRSYFTSKSQRAKRLYHHLRSFGLIHGSRSARQSFRSAVGTVRIFVPGYRSSILLRTGTSDVYTFEKVIVEREYDHGELTDECCIIDAGANIGCSSVFFAERYPNGKVIAIEPDPTNYEFLLANTRNYPNVYPVQAALWFESTTLSIENPGHSTDSFIVRDDGGSQARSVRAVTVEEMLIEVGMTKVDLLKVDIESAEKEVFEGSLGSAWLAAVDVIMIELHDRIKPGCSAAFYRAICEYNFSQEVVGEIVVISKDGAATVGAEVA